MSTQTTSLGETVEREEEEQSQLPPPPAPPGRLAELWSFRYLLVNLIIRDLKVRYKNSVLGIFWSLLNPLLMMGVFWVVFSVLLAGAVDFYPVFLLVALLPWNFFSHCLIAGTNSITGDSAVIRKVYFPRELLPLSTIASNLVNFLLAFIVLVALLYISGIGLTRHALWVPLILLTQTIFVLGLALLLSALHVHYRDVMMLLDVGVLAWFFLTPVFYPFEFLTQTSRTIFGLPPATIMRWLNPMASIIDGYRTVLWGTLESQGTPAAMDPIFLLRTFITSLVVLIVGYAVFMRLQPTFGEKL